MPSNKAQNINTGGAEYSMVRVFKTTDEIRYGSDVRTLHGMHTKEWLGMMKVVQEYIRADYVVEYEEKTGEELLKEGVTPRQVLFTPTNINPCATYAFVKCKPPLFDEVLG
jgi:hypothetical protein